MAKKSLRQYIEDHGEEAAANRLGVTVRAIRSWRYGQRSPRLREIPKLIERAGGELAFESFVSRAA